MVYHTTYAPGQARDGTDYGSFRDLRPAVTAAIRACEDRSFDMIVVRGASGMSIGFPLALALGVDIAVVRKDFEIAGGCHGFDRILGTSLKGKRCLFVDDFVSSGETRTAVRQAVEEDGGRLVAQYMSRENAYTTL